MTRWARDAYEKAQEKIWEDWDARSNAYYDALKALRSKGTSYPAAFLHFTQETGTLLSAEENTVLSPANLYLAFAMLSETTDGDSRAQLLSLLGLENTDAPRAAGNYVWRNLYGETSTGKTLLGSSVWLNENVPYNEETLQVLAEQYLASTFSAPMGDEKTDKAIGEWINENTGNLLQDAAGEIQTKPETVMLLLTTLYFKDQWRDEFWKDATKKDTFTAASGEKQTVDFMHRTDDRAAYYRGENYTVAELGFRGGQSMRFLLPDEGTTLESLLANGEVVGGLMAYDMDAALPSAEIHWSVPKFDVDSNLELTDALKAMGVTDVFDFNKADFSPLVDKEKFDESVAVTQVQHAARVKVDEKGLRGRSVHGRHGGRHRRHARRASSGGDESEPAVCLYDHRRGRSAALPRHGEYIEVISHAAGRCPIVMGLRGAKGAFSHVREGPF